MYNPPHFAETRREALTAAITRHPLATLITVGSSGITANHIPLLYREPGLLCGHMARGNPQWKDFREDFDALAIFSGPEAYISPNWYPSKEEHGKVVPTWNYVVVHAHGKLIVHYDVDWLRRNVTALTEINEARTSSEPWKVTDAPEEYIAGMLKAIVGVELQITRLEGKWKVSQNRPPADREAVAESLRIDGNDSMADLVIDQSNIP